MVKVGDVFSVQGMVAIVLLIVLGLAFTGVISTSTTETIFDDLVNTGNSSEIHHCDSGIANFTIACISGNYNGFINLSNHTNGVLIPASNYTVNTTGSICINEFAINDSSVRYSYNCYDTDPTISTSTRGLLVIVPILFVTILIGILGFLFVKSELFKKMQSK